jgi:hypothetical protein
LRDRFQARFALKLRIKKAEVIAMMRRANRPIQPARVAIENVETLLNGYVQDLSGNSKLVSRTVVN